MTPAESAKGSQSVQTETIKSTLEQASATSPLSDSGETKEQGPSHAQAIFRWIVMGVLVPVHICLLGWLACCTSPTSDEIAHLAAGVRIWTQGQFGTYPVNPPLVKLIATWPVVMSSPRTDWRHLDATPGARPEWLIGQDYLKANSPRFRWDFVLARWMCLPFCIVGLMYCFWWGSELFGPAGGLLSAALWCFSPDILAHGALITPDVAAAAIGVATLFHFRRWLRSALWKDALLAGVFLGLLQLTKMSWLLLYPLLPVIWWFSLTLHMNRKSRQRQFLQLAALMVLSLDLLNAGYLFDRSFKPLGEFEFVSQTLSGSAEAETSGNRFRGTWMETIPVPLPEPYLIGLDLQRRDFEGHWKPLVSYLRGEMRIGGWWNYYLYGLLVKVPLGTWLIAGCALLAAGVAWKAQQSLPAVEFLWLMAPALGLLLLISSQTGFSRYVRYVIPCLPFCFVLLGGCWSRVVWERARGVTLVTGAGLLCTVWASLSVYPHSLSFFNRIAGGPLQGHWFLLDSNVDWGQDLYFLKSWMNEHLQSRPLTLAYAGVADPGLFDLDVQPFSDRDILRSETIPPGWYAISVNHLHGYDSAPMACSRFLPLKPTARAGYSILIYHIPETAPP